MTTTALTALVLLFSSLANGESRPLDCQIDSSVPGLPVAQCEIPSCPKYEDCDGPQITVQRSEVEYFEPVIQWREPCTNKNLSLGPCWELAVDVNLQLDAHDPSGISAVGVKLFVESGNDRKFLTLWDNVHQINLKGKFEIRKPMHINSLAANNIEFGVHELCARDKVGNQTCVPAGHRLDNPSK